MGKMGLFVVCIFCPYLCSCDSAALVSLRPGSLRAWIFLVGCSYAPRQQVPLMKLCLWHVNYGAEILLSSCVSFLEA